MTCSSSKKLSLKLSPKLTTKEKLFVDARLAGMSQAAAHHAAGYGDTNNVYEIEKREHVQKELVRRMEKTAEEVDFGRKEAHEMLMQAYTNADTAMEQIAAVREMIKLHGIAVPQKIEHDHQHTHELSLDRMPLKQLMELANMEGLTLDGECTVVEATELIGPPAPEE